MMKNVWMFFFFIFLGRVTHAQEKSIPFYKCPHHHLTIYKTNPFSILWGSIPLTSEYKLLREEVVSKNESLLAGFSYLGKGPFIALTEDTLFRNMKVKVHGFRFQLGYRAYMNWFSNLIGMDEQCHAPRGVYFSPLFSFSTASFELIGTGVRENLQIRHVNMNFLMGYQAQLGGRLYLDAFAGLGWKNNKWFELQPNGSSHTIPADIGPFYNGPLKITLGGSIGIGLNKTGN